MEILFRLRTDDQELMQMAALHDVVEDSNLSIDDLRDEGFSERVIAAMILMTHEKDESYSQYIRAISGNEDAVKIKLEDLRDNSDITRLKGVREKDLQRMQKYHRAYLFLSGKLEHLD